jgi:hypothetical protein
MIESTFRVQFPEFNGVSSALVNATLSAALLEIDTTIWGIKADQGQGYLTAIKLALSPFGQNARMIAKDGTTVYHTSYNALVRQISSGFRVA